MRPPGQVLVILAPERGLPLIILPQHCNPDPQTEVQMYGTWPPEFRTLDQASAQIPLHLTTRKNICVLFL